MSHRRRPWSRRHRPMPGLILHGQLTARTCWQSPPGMLKRRDYAEDVVQEAFARLAASRDAIEDVRGWLVVVTRRL